MIKSTKTEYAHIKNYTGYNIYKIYYNMEPDYWGGQAPPVGLLGGPVAPRPPLVPTLLLWKCFIRGKDEGRPRTVKYRTTFGY